MIMDCLTNWKCYSNGNQKVWREAFDFIASGDSETEEKKYLLLGDELLR